MNKNSTYISQKDVAYAEKSAKIAAAVKVVGCKLIQGETKFEVTSVAIESATRAQVTVTREDGESMTVLAGDLVAMVNAGEIALA